MEVNRNKVGTITFLSPDFPLIGENMELLASEIQRCLEEKEHRVIIDLIQVPFIDSRGLEKLLDFYHQIRSRGGSIKVANPNPLCHEILEVTRMSRYFNIYFDLEKAARSFS